MTRDDLLQQLTHFVAQGVRVPEQAFEIARSVQLERFERTSPRAAALTILRMGLQRRYDFLTVTRSMLDRIEEPASASRPRSLSPARSSARSTSRLSS